ncbi:hypothetical protein [Pseudoduganella flava]|uniref:hypothetical protein n=1 Tax=Pseudoduganella flava TaxID=871742 RepID=UPI0018EF2DD8|nr:hypothetical protein [Pseudoduganella flava]
MTDLFNALFIDASSPVGGFLAREYQSNRHATARLECTVFGGSNEVVSACEDRVVFRCWGLSLVLF